MGKESATAVAERVAENVVLIAVARVSMVVTPFILGTLAIWLITTTNDLHRRVGIIESSRAATREEVYNRLNSVEAQNRTEAVSWQNILERLSRVETTQQAMLRALERVERGIDGERRDRRQN